MTKARELALCFVHWLQTDAVRPDGGAGYPGMRLCPDVLGTQDGLAAAAYVRESRRIASEFTVLETHVGVEARPGADRAEAFPDTVGVGSYRIDLHPSTARRGYLDIATYPFQIPLGALLPLRLGNLAAGKCPVSPTSPMAATGSTLWNGTSARPLALWPRSASAVE